MFKFRNLVACLSAATALLWQTSAAHEAEIDVSRTAAGKLQAEIAFEQPHPLELSIFPGINGHATGLLGIHSVIFDVATNDVFQIAPEADLRFILVEHDPGMEIVRDGGVGGFMQTNESFYIGVAPFDTHPLWNLTNGVIGETRSLTLKLHDVNGLYTDSDSFTLSFTPLVAPVLEVLRENSSSITLSWPLDADDWSLESAAAVNAPTWNSVTNVPVNTGTNFSLTLDADGAQKYFRLHRQ
jgi:hypothetical protein